MNPVAARVQAVFAKGESHCRDSITRSAANLRRLAHVVQMALETCPSGATAANCRTGPFRAVPVAAGPRREVPFPGLSL
jgi:hypothetical protein